MLHKNKLISNKENAGSNGFISFLSRQYNRKLIKSGDEPTAADPNLNNLRSKKVKPLVISNDEVDRRLPNPFSNDNLAKPVQAAPSRRPGNDGIEYREDADVEVHYPAFLLCDSRMGITDKGYLKDRKRVLNDLITHSSPLVPIEEM